MSFDQQDDDELRNLQRDDRRMRPVRPKTASAARQEALEARAQLRVTQETFQDFRDAAESMVGDLDLRSLVQVVLDFPMRVTGAERGILFLGDGRETGLVPVMVRNALGDEVLNIERISETMVRMSSRGEVITTHDALTDPRFRDIRSVRVGELHAIACLPMIWQDRCIAVLYLDAPASEQLTRPASLEFLNAFSGLAAMALENARRYAALVQENAMILRRLPLEKAFESFIAHSPATQLARNRAALAAQVDIPLLIVGEPGTGRTLLARLIHRNSSRALGPFQVFDCQAAPRDRHDAYLFGVAKGTHSGAVREHEGLLRRADRGMILLQEVSELTTSVQERLRRVLRTGTVRPVYSRKDYSLDLRIAATTSRHLREQDDSETLMEDLYQKLAALEIVIPPLRERSEDVPALADHFLRLHARTMGIESPGSFGVDALEYLRTFPWPGNVRQLENLCRRMLIISPGARYDLARVKNCLHQYPEGEEEQSADLERGYLVQSLSNQQRDTVLHALQRTRGNRARAAQLLGIHRNTLNRWIRNLGIDTQTN